MLQLPSLCYSFAAVTPIVLSIFSGAGAVGHPAAAVGRAAFVVASPITATARKRPHSRRSLWFTSETSTTTAAAATSAALAFDETIPPGRVQDRDEWVRWSSDSLKRWTGKSLLDRIEYSVGHDDDGGLLGDCDVERKSSTVLSYERIHENVRFAVLSHGTQNDPIYNYFNRAALEQFEYPENEIYQIPSRCSAPATAQGERDAVMQKIVGKEEEEANSTNNNDSSKNCIVIENGLRVTKGGRKFWLKDVLLWNVLNNAGERVGQTALFDRNLTVHLDEI
jgi:MEKHLA domain